MLPILVKMEFLEDIVASVIFLGLYLATNAYCAKVGAKSKTKNRSNETAVYLQRIFGLLTFGLLTLCYIKLSSKLSLADYGTILSQPLKTTLWTCSSALIIIPLSVFNSAKPSNLKVYPQIRVQRWNFRLILLSGLSWTAYLLCYEFFFRGFLLFACERATGIYVATAINVILYAVAHLPKGKFETIGAIPFGILLCISAFATGSFWAPFGIHLTMTLSNEWMSIFYSERAKFFVAA